MKNLIQRLRDYAENDCEVSTQKEFIGEAADALERLTSGDVELPVPVTAFKYPDSPFSSNYYTEDQLRDYGYRRAAAMVRKPLSDAEVHQIAVAVADEMYPGVPTVGWTEEDSRFFGLFTRAIEAAHRIGEKA